MSVLITKIPPSVIDEHREQEAGRALVAAHRARVERPQQPVAQEGREVEALVAGAIAGQPDDGGDRDDEQRPRSTNRPRIRAIVPRPMNSSKR